MHWCVNLGYPAFVLPYLFRAYRLYWVFNVNRETLELNHSNQRQNRSEQRKKFKKYVHRASQTHLLKWFMICMMPFVILSVVDMLTDLNVLPISFLGCKKFSPSFYAIFWICVHFVEALSFIVAVVCLRRGWDAYNIKYELHFVCIVSCVCVFIFFLSKLWHIMCVWMYP